jgi:hypothetical protein
MDGTDGRAVPARHPSALGSTNRAYRLSACSPQGDSEQSVNNLLPNTRENRLPGMR